MTQHNNDRRDTTYAMAAADAGGASPAGRAYNPEARFEIKETEIELRPTASAAC